jgi:hypothetical protein
LASWQFTCILIWMFRIIAVCLLLTLAMGCSSPGGTISFDSYDQQRTWTSSFNQAYISQNQTGETDIVLIDSGELNQFPRMKKNEPLQPTPISPIRQMMRIHLYWQPLTGTKKNPAAINASIDWYVFGREDSDDLLIYEGAGFVVVEDDGRKQNVRIRDGEIKPRRSYGLIHDPVGFARISGIITAQVNRIRVADTIAQMDQLKNKDGWNSP